MKDSLTLKWQIENKIARIKGDLVFLRHLYETNEVNPFTKVDMLDQISMREKELIEVEKEYKLLTKQGSNEK